MNAMRIVQQVSDFGLGGIQKAACVLADTMADEGHATWVVASDSGPRFRPTSRPTRQHIVLGTHDPALIVKAILALRPDVIHFHGCAYSEDALRALNQIAPTPRPLVVSTPVFGRPPVDPTILRLSRTCCVGSYAFYRLCKWLSMSPDIALGQGIAYVPLTPYTPAPSPVSTLDSDDLRNARRSALGIHSSAFVCGRIGRDDLHKWSPLNYTLVDRLLSSFPQVQWLSVGFPSQLGADALASRWGRRFLNIPCVVDAQELANLVSSFDLQVFFSRYGECFASSIAEAAGVGVPTIALSTPLHDNGQAEQILDGVTGYLVGGVDGALSAAKRLINDSQALRRLKQSCMTHAHSRWHAVRVARDLLDFYAEWASGSLRSTHRDALLREADAFRATYRARAVKIAFEEGLLHAIKTTAGLPLVESWPTFVTGRTLMAGARWALRRSRGAIEGK